MPLLAVERSILCNISFFAIFIINFVIKFNLFQVIFLIIHNSPSPLSACNEAKDRFDILR